MKKAFLGALLLVVALAACSKYADAQVWKNSDPQMSKAPPTDLEKAIQKLPLAKLPSQPKKVVAKRVVEKPGASIGMTKKQVVRDTDWGKPEATKRVVNADGTWDFWYYNDGDSVLTFLDGELYEIEVDDSNECE
jgi:hypothetical protein